jgi:glycosyltransferase involved in cell wall biosynthesis
VVFAGIEKGGRDQDRQADGSFAYQGFTYVPAVDRAETRLSRMKRGLLTHLAGTTTMRRLRVMDLSTTHAVIAYHAPALLLGQLERFCRKRGIALVADAPEWYDPRHLLGGPLGPVRWDSEIRMRWLQPRIGRVIAISSFLERYYRRRGCAVVRVPPLIDMDDPLRREDESRRPPDGALRLVYAGSPGRKDPLGNAIRGLRDLRAAGRPVELHLVGPGPQAIAGCLDRDAGLLDELGAAIVWHGRVAQADAMRLVAQADFSILLRPDKRYAQAGFPTKLVESLSLGVPVLTNLTSDIGEYVRDGVEGVIARDSSAQAFAAAVDRTLEMPRSRWTAMRGHARQRATECFDYRRYAAPLKQFLDDAGSEGPRRSR